MVNLEHAQQDTEKCIFIIVYVRNGNVKDYIHANIFTIRYVTIFQFNVRCVSMLLSSIFVSEGVLLTSDKL